MKGLLFFQMIVIHDDVHDALHDDGDGAQPQDDAPRDGDVPYGGPFDVLVRMIVYQRGTPQPK